MRETEAGSAGANGTTASAPVYLRLQKRAERSTGRAPHRAAFPWRAFGATATVLAIAATVWIFFRTMETDARFRLRGVELRGAHYVDRTDVEEVFAADHGRSISRLPLE